MTTTETPKATPRLTVKKLDDKVEKYRNTVNERFADYDRLHEAHDNITSALDRDLSINEYRTDKLMRKSHGITRANAEVEALKKRFNDLVAKLGEDVDPLIREGASNAAKDVEARLETLFGELSGDYNTLKATVDEHTGQLAEHDERISAAAMEAGMATEGVHSLNSRVTVFEEAVKFPFVRFLISAIIGLIAGLIWNAHTFAQSSNRADGSPYTIHYVADAWWVAVLVGLAVSAGLFWVLTLFRRKAKTEATQETRVTEVRKQRKPFFRHRVVRNSNVPPIPQPETPIKETTDADTSPTEVLVTSSGATSARS